MVSSGTFQAVGDQVENMTAGTGATDNTKRHVDSVKLFISDLFINRELMRDCGD